MDLAVASFDAAASRLLSRVGHWSEARWSQPARGPMIADQTSPTRADVVHGLLQRLADLCASAEGEPARPVPRLANDLALPDQIRVVVADLRAASASATALRSAAADLTTTAARL